MEFSIRQAIEPDLESIYSFDCIAQTGTRRRHFLERAVSEGKCFVIIANRESRPVAYAVLEDSFYGYGFISMLCVDPHHRRQSYGAALMNHLETICQTEKIFTSTNLSNVPMQSLLAKLGYKLSGVIHNLDEGDPELVYYKMLHRNAV